VEKQEDRKVLGGVCWTSFVIFWRRARTYYDEDYIYRGFRWMLSLVRKAESRIIGGERGIVRAEFINRSCYGMQISK
jgi:hypothetical protein